MDYRHIALGLLVCCLKLSGASDDLLAEEQARRHQTAMEWNEMTQRGESAIKEWLEANRGEEQLESRGYSTFWDNAGSERYLLIETGLKPAKGNYGSIDFVVVRENRKRKPIVYHFGEYTDRYPIKIVLLAEGVSVDFLVREGNDSLPQTHKICLLKFVDDGLLEEAVHVPDTTVITDSPVSNKRQADHGLYVVQPGDTAAKIARVFNLKIDQLVALNPAVNWTRLKVGQKIQVEPIAAMNP